MYAVIELQGAQVRIAEKDKFIVNRMEAQEDKAVKVEKVLFGQKGASHFIGEPYVKGAYVECEIVADKRLKEVIAFKYRDRKSSQSKKGHRQDVTELVVKKIHFPEVAKATEAKKEEKKEEKTKSEKK
ncbi:MAG: 50S ribosomal protein L21 [Candidatus Tantalella remota]|nr:50S ribosomal protein L21 [Candidatus Tantalella remota]